uniref:Uncharacterized protein n=1 Tax=Anguilla anguilla TaxID=7936 RepID=A0A0E9UWW1_ANGAN
MVTVQSFHCDQLHTSSFATLSYHRPS